MKTAVLVLCLVASVLTVPTNRYATVVDGEGKPHFIDLTAALPPAPRVDAGDVTFYLHTPDTPAEGIKASLQDFDGYAADLNPALPVHVLIHGWTLDYNFFTDAIVAFAEAGIDANIIIVDYSPVSKLFYTMATAAHNQVGQHIADGLTKISEVHSIALGAMCVVGHSMGGHVAGAVGAHLGGALKLIQALDPAGPLFDIAERADRLDDSDAQWVEVVHTNGGFLGYRPALGHADYFPNGGGMNQAGCGEDLLGVCAHMRPVYYYYESIKAEKQGGKLFVAKQCDSYADFKSNKCNDNASQKMLLLSGDMSVAGTFYLDTEETAPFAQD